MVDYDNHLAHLFNTHAIISDEHRELISGFVFNKFRGDHTFLHSGLHELEALTGVETKAVIPFIGGLWLDAEDSLQMNTSGVIVDPAGQKPVGNPRLTSAVIRLPRISNITDIDAFVMEPGVTVTGSGMQIRSRLLTGW